MLAECGQKYFYSCQKTEKKSFSAISTGKVVTSSSFHAPITPAIIYGGIFIGFFFFRWLRPLSPRELFISPPKPQKQSLENA